MMITMMIMMATQNNWECGTDESLMISLHPIRTREEIQIFAQRKSSPTKKQNLWRQHNNIYIYSCQFDVTDKQGAETKRLEKFLVVVRQMRHEGLKSLTTNSNKIWQKWINGWNGGILFNLSDLVRQTETLKIFEEIAKGVFYNLFKNMSF